LSGRALALGCVATLALSAGSAAANGFEDFGKTFHEKLQSKIHQELSGVVHASVQPLESQEFNWYYALNSGFNHKTWNELDKMVRPNDVGAMKLVDGTSFTDTYRNRVLASITFKLSNADQTRENKVDDDASAAATTMVNQFEQVYGDITQKQLNKAKSETGLFKMTKADYITDYVVSYFWTCAKRNGGAPKTLNQLNIGDLSTSLPCAGSSSSQVLGPISKYLSIKSQVSDITAQQQLGGFKLNNLRNNVEHPHADSSNQNFNGGQALDNGSVQPEYVVGKSISAVNSSLQGGNTVSMKMSMTKVDQGTVKASFQSGASASVPIDIFRLGVKGGQKANLFAFKGVKESATIKMTWNGVTVFDTNAKTYTKPGNRPHGVGWYSSTVIRKAYENEGEDVTGYHFNGQPPFSFGKGSDFARVSKLIISQFPKIDMTFQVEDITKFKQSYKQQSTWNISFLGIPLGSASESFYEGSYHYDKQAGSVTVSFRPKGTTFQGSQLNQAANTLAAVVQYPGSDN